MRKRARLSYSNVVATLALCIALGGGTAIAHPVADVASGIAKSVKSALKIAKHADKNATQALTNAGTAQTTANNAGTAAAAASSKADAAAAAAAGAYTKSESDQRFLGIAAKAADSRLLEGKPASQFLAATAKSADADKLDGIDSTGFLGAGAKAADADQLDGIDSTGFLAVDGKAADADKLDGQSSSAFVPACPAGSSRLYDLCVSAQQTATDWTNAGITCANQNPALRLPTMGEALEIVRALGNIANESWTTDATDATHAMTYVGFVSIQEKVTSTSLAFRCVSTPMATGTAAKPVARAQLLATR